MPCALQTPSTSNPTNAAARRLYHEFAEHEPILINEFNKVTLGQLDAEKFADDTGKQIQDILDKPNV